MPFKFSFNKKSSNMVNIQDKNDSDSEFLKAINLFKNQRTKNKISIEELSKKTKISTNVLIAIENGWKKYLPEKTYLTSMLNRLEIELDLEIGSLNGILIRKNIKKNSSGFKLKFINIDFCTCIILNFYLLLPTVYNFI